MKKITLLFLSLLTFSAFAQVKIDSTGNVGIGTTDPGDFKLNVSGTAMFGGFVNINEPAILNTEVPLFQLGGDINGLKIIKYWDTGGIAWRFNKASGANIMTLNQGGNVGIGTLDPVSKLDVNGSLTLNNLLAFRGNSGENRLYLATTSPSNNNSTNTTVIRGRQVDLFAYDDVVLRAGTTDKIRFIAGDSQRVVINQDGNVGIGTTSPNSKLEVNGDVSIGNGANYGNILFKSLTPNTILGYNGTFEILSKTIPGSGVAKYLTHFKTNTATLAGETRHDVIIDGNLGIGNIDALGNVFNNGGFKLAVNGKIGAKDLVVENSTQPWPDYVFEKDYNLLSLKEVEQHIKEKGHLPNIPSAKEVKEKGSFSLGEMNKKLLEKVEELMLYTIQQEKEIKKIKNQEERIKKIEEENKKLKSLLERVTELEKSMKK